MKQNWSCEKIPKSQNSDKATSFSSGVVNIASSVQKVSCSKPLHNKSRCLNTMKSFLAFKVISTWILAYFQKGFTMKLWQNTKFTTAILFCFIFTAKRDEYNVIVRDSKPGSDCLNYQDHWVCIKQLLDEIELTIVICQWRADQLFAEAEGYFAITEF